MKDEKALAGASAPQNTKENNTSSGINVPPQRIDEFEKKLDLRISSGSLRYEETIKEYHKIAGTLVSKGDFERLKDIIPMIIKLNDIMKELDQPEISSEPSNQWLADVKDEVIGKREEINKQRFAQLINDKYAFRSVPRAGEFLRYDPKYGYFRNDAAEFVANLARKILPDDSTTHTVNEVINWIRDYNYTAVQDFDRLPERKINVQNGVYDIETRKLLPHSPEYNFRYVLPFKFNHRARKSKFLNEVLPEITKDDPRKAIRILEAFAWPLIPGYPIQKASVLYGNGSNGKSTILGVLIAFLGRENVSGISLQTLCENRFAVANLRGKLANVAGDVGSQALVNSSVFKNATGDDLMSGEIKGLQGEVQFWNQAKMIFGLNTIPRTYDSSDAYYRRFELTELIQKFTDSEEGSDSENTDHKAKSNILNELTTEEELQALFNLVAQIFLPAMLKKLRFEFTEGTQKTREKYDLLGDPAVAFIRERIEANADGQLPCEEVYSAFVKWCKGKGINAASDRSFGYSLQSKSDIVVHRKKIQEKGERLHYYVGIGWKDKDSDYETSLISNGRIITHPILETKQRWDTFSTALNYYVQRHNIEKSVLSVLSFILSEKNEKNKGECKSRSTWDTSKKEIHIERLRDSPKESVPSLKKNTPEVFERESARSLQPSEDARKRYVLDLLIDSTYNSTKKFRSPKVLADLNMNPIVNISDIFRCLEALREEGTVVQRGIEYGFKGLVKGDTA